MKDRIVNTKNQKKPSREHVLQVTALLFLKEALLRERYEECAHLIRSAKRYGAEQRQVRAILNGHVRGMNVSRTNGAGAKRKGRLRF